MNSTTGGILILLGFTIMEVGLYMIHPGLAIVGFGYAFYKLATG